MQRLICEICKYARTCRETRVGLRRLRLKKLSRRFLRHLGTTDPVTAQRRKNEAMWALINGDR